MQIINLIINVTTTVQYV